MNNIMIDLETLGTRPTAAILSIGAVFFDKEGFGEEFYQTITLDSCTRAGLTISGDTFKWWMAQKAEARKALFESNHDLTSTLLRFDGWIHQHSNADKVLVWGNGADFDNAIMQHAYAAVDRPVPWKFWNNRCYRTTTALLGKAPRNQEGVYHNALDDAKSQAKHLITVLNDRGLAL